MQNKTRAMRPLSELRTSQSPSPIARHTGRPTGQPNSTVLMSLPITSRSSRGSESSHSRTGSLPPG